MNFQIYSVIVPHVVKFCVFKTLWIFLFVIVCLTMFLIFMNSNHKKELKKAILSGDAVENVHDKINNLKQDLKSKVTEEPDEMKPSTSKRTSLKPNKKLSSRNLYKKLMNDIKREVMKSEHELTELEHEIIMLSKRRKDVQYEISKVSVVL